MLVVTGSGADQPWDVVFEIVASVVAIRVVASCAKGSTAEASRDAVIGLSRIEIHPYTSHRRNRSDRLHAVLALRQKGEV